MECPFCLHLTNAETQHNTTHIRQQTKQNSPEALHGRLVLRARFLGRAHRRWLWRWPLLLPSTSCGNRNLNAQRKKNTPHQREHKSPPPAPSAESWTRRPTPQWRDPVQPPTPKQRACRASPQPSSAPLLTWCSLQRPGRSLHQASLPCPDNMHLHIDMHTTSKSANACSPPTPCVRARRRVRQGVDDASQCLLPRWLRCPARSTCASSQQCTASEAQSHTCKQAQPHAQCTKQTCTTHMHTALRVHSP